MTEKSAEPLIHVGQGERVSETVIKAIADAEGIDPVDLEDCLYDILDPDALDAVFRERGDSTNRTGGRIVFPMAGYLVMVRGDGTVAVTPLRQEGVSEQVSTARISRNGSPNSEAGEGTEDNGQNDSSASNAGNG